MILAIDIGNTNITVGAITTDLKVQFVSRLSTQRDRTADEVAASLLSMLDLYKADWHDIDGSVISSVVPQLTGSFSVAVNMLFGFSPVILQPGVKSGLNICIDNPAQLGGDLVATAVAAIHLYGAPVIVIDMGTATKISAINDKSQFIGCSISPGIRISVDALSSRTAQLPQISLAAPRSPIGANSIDSMGSGIIYGNACMVDGMCEKFMETLGRARIVATGGYSRYIIPHCTNDIILNDDLVLVGLALVYNKQLG